MEGRPMTREEAAIFATKEYLVKLLNEKSWCQARQVGQALEILVNAEKQRVLTPTGLAGLGGSRLTSGEED